MDRGDFRNAHAFLVGAEERSFAPRDSFVAYFDVSGKEKITLGPAAGLEGLSWHNYSEQNLKPKRNSYGFISSLKSAFEKSS